MKAYAVGGDHHVGERVSWKNMYQLILQLVVVEEPGHVTGPGEPLRSRPVASGPAPASAAA